MEKYEVVVVGGGVAGSFTALLSAISGFKTSLLEASTSPNGATSLSGGVVTRMMDNPIDRELASISLDLITRYVSKDCIHLGYVCVESYRYAEKDFEKFREYIPDLVLLDAEEARDRWEYIKLFDDEVILYAPSDLTLNPYEMLRDLWGKILDSGCDLITGKRVTKVDVKMDVVKGLVTQGGDYIKAEVFIFCAGPWNTVLLKSIGIDLNLWLLGVPIFKFEVVSSSDLVGVWDEYVYSYWRPENSFLIGGVYDAFSIDTPEKAFIDPSQENINNVLEGFKYRFNFSEWKLVGGWCGPISISRDYRPIYGLVEGFSNLYIIDGLGGRGLMRGPALAKRLVSEYLAR